MISMNKERDALPFPGQTREEDSIKVGSLKK